MHRGSPKVWYVFPPDPLRPIEEFLSRAIYNASILNMSPSYVRQFNGAKVHNVNPSIFAEYGSSVRVYEALQTGGNFIVTSPMSYHYGVNLGYEEAEAVNYVNPTWLYIVKNMNKIPTHKQMQNSLLMPFKYVLRCEVYHVLQERTKRGLENSSQCHSEGDMEVGVTSYKYRNKAEKNTCNELMESTGTSR